jgi:hypothetical protein
MSSFQVGQRVKVIHEVQEFPGLNEEMQDLLKETRLFTIKRITHDGLLIFHEVNWFWSGSWCVPAGPPETKEEQIVRKINQLWERQSYVRERTL